MLKEFRFWSIWTTFMHSSKTIWITKKPRCDNFWGGLWSLAIWQDFTVLPQNFGTKKGTLLGWGIEKSLNSALNYAKKDIRVLFGANANSKFHQSQSLAAKLKITTFGNLASPNLEPPSSQVPSVFWNLFWNLFKSQNHSNDIHPCRNKSPVGFSKKSDFLGENSTKWKYFFDMVKKKIDPIFFLSQSEH